MTLHFGTQLPKDGLYAGGRRARSAPRPDPARRSRLVASLRRPGENTRGCRRPGLGVRPARVSGVVVPAEPHVLFAGGGSGSGGGVYDRVRNGAGSGAGAEAPAGLDLEAEVLVGRGRRGDVRVVGLEILVLMRVRRKGGEKLAPLAWNGERLP